jgi:hypothetical protein
MRRKLVEVDEALMYIQANHIFLHYDARVGVDLWSPHRKVSIKVRRSVYKHREQLLEMLQSGDSRVCPSPERHRKYWKQQSCLLCRMIDSSLVEGSKTA